MALTIQTVDAQAEYTKELFAIYNDRILPTGFLRSFFPSVVKPTLEVSAEIQRSFEKVATDVARGTDGNRNQFTKSSEKIWIPLYYREWFDRTQLQLYDRLYGVGSISDMEFVAYINDVADHMMDLRAKIERSLEVQCSQVLENGIVIVNAGPANIDFKRKATSIVDLNTTSGYWATGSNNPFTAFKAAGDFMRKVAKAQGGVFNAILGDQALTDLLANTTFTARQNLFNMSIDAITTPQRNAVGSVFHGRISAGPYTFNLWSYPQFYDDSNGTSTPYVNTKKVIILPENPKFNMVFGAVPQLLNPGEMPKVGDFIFNEYIERRSKAAVMDVESAALAIPVAVDQIYTMQAVP